MPARAAGFFVEFSTAMLNRIFTDDDLAAVRAGSVLAAFFRISAVTAFSPDDHRLSLHAEELRGKSEKFRRERLASRAMLADFLRSTAENPLPLFSFGRYGRPYFTGSGMPFFSISHSGEHILLTMSKKSVGADVEAIRLRKGAQGIADRYFTPAEAGCVRKYGQRAFFRLWTIREAVSKFTGGGIQDFSRIRIDPRGFSVSVDDCEDPPLPLISETESLTAAIAVPVQSEVRSVMIDESGRHDAELLWHVPEPEDPDEP